MGDFEAESDRYERLAADFDEGRAPRRHPRRKKKTKEPRYPVQTEPQQPENQNGVREQEFATAKEGIAKDLARFLKIKGDDKKSKEQKIAEQAQAYSQWVQKSLNVGVIFDRKDITIEPHPKKKKKNKVIVTHTISLIPVTIDKQPLENQESRAIGAIHECLEKHISTWQRFIDNSENPSRVDIGKTVTGMLKELAE